MIAVHAPTLAAGSVDRRLRNELSDSVLAEVGERRARYRTGGYLRCPTMDLGPGRDRNSDAWRELEAHWAQIDARQGESFRATCARLDGAAMRPSGVYRAVAAIRAAKAQAERHSLTAVAFAAGSILTALLGQF